MDKITLLSPDIFFGTTIWCLLNSSTILLLITRNLSKSDITLKVLLALSNITGARLNFKLQDFIRLFVPVIFNLQGSEYIHALIIFHG